MEQGIQLMHVVKPDLDKAKNPHQPSKLTVRKGLQPSKEKAQIPTKVDCGSGRANEDWLNTITL